MNILIVSARDSGAWMSSPRDNCKGRRIETSSRQKGIWGKLHLGVQIKEHIHHRLTKMFMHQLYYGGGGGSALIESQDLMGCSW